jgi:hypothetical protein
MHTMFSILRNSEKATNMKCHVTAESRDSLVGIATDELEGRGSILDGDNKFFSTPQCPDQHWDPKSLIHNGQRGLFLRG